MISTELTIWGLVSHDVNDLVMIDSSNGLLLAILQAT